MKTSELTGAALDWAVAKCEGYDTLITYAPLRVMYEPQGKRSWYVYRPESNWKQGGPIIERENIGLVCQQPDSTPRCAYRQTPDGEVFYYYGDTPLIAAMCCFVASKLGDEVEIPEELQ